ncbi:MAG: amidase [Pseudomonadota bacterium]
MSVTPNHPAFVKTITKATNMLDIQVISNALEGLRLAVKDVFDIARMPTGAGNPDWLKTHPMPAQTHSSVTSLLRNGAELVGKTVTDELAYSLNGQNIHYPDLLNVVTPERLCGGSSSGSAAAVAGSMADIGLGTDTGGSIRVPASYNGLFGLRPTHGVIKSDNMVRLAPSFDTVGWLTKDIDILERVALVFLSKDQVSETSVLDSTVPLKLCIPKNLVDSAEHAEQIYDWLTKLTESDFPVEITNIELDTGALQTSESFRVLQGIEIWDEHGEWINEYKPTFAEDIQKRVDWCRQLTQAQKEQAENQRQLIIKHLSTVFEKQSAMIIPTTPGRSPLLSMPTTELATYREDLMSLTAIAGLSGRPQIHLPLFTIQGAPCGISFIGHRNADLQLIAMAKHIFQHVNQIPSVSNK